MKREKLLITPKLDGEGSGLENVAAGSGWVSAPSPKHLQEGVCDSRSSSQRPWEATHCDWHREKQTKILHGRRSWVKLVRGFGEASGKNTQAAPLAGRVLLGRPLVHLGLSFHMCQRKKLGASQVLETPTLGSSRGWREQPQEVSA